jgi:hypothetical protein
MNGQKIRRIKTASRDQSAPGRSQDASNKRKSIIQRVPGGGRELSASKYGHCPEREVQSGT